MSAPTVKILCGDALEKLKELPSGSVHCVVTSPPYWGLRDYKVDGQLGLEKTPEEYVNHLVEVFREVRRVLRDDGTVWLNLGDSYARTGGWASNDGLDGCKRGESGRAKTNLQSGRNGQKRPSNLKEKDLVGIPWRVAFALRADGWYLRSDIIWCLSGGARVYAKTSTSVGPMMIRDIARLDPSTVQLWNGSAWVSVRGFSNSGRTGDEIEIVLRSGERITCTPEHRWPTSNGVVRASDLKVGSVLVSVPLPDSPKTGDILDTDAAYFAGLYIAEGSRSEDTIQIAGNASDAARWERVKRIAEKFAGSATVSIDGNNQSIRVYGKILNAIIDELVSGRVAKNKCFSPKVWRRDNNFISAMLDGYLAGDGHYDEPSDRWRLGFCRNYNLERDLRAVCARLGYCITLNPSTVSYNGRDRPTFRGEIRFSRSGHHNEADRNEVVGIRRGRCRELYDIGLDEPHVFALASGILSHNSKPNPMPESVRDRPTKSHEYIFLLTKSERYFFDQEAVREPIINPGKPRAFAKKGNNDRNDTGDVYDPSGRTGRNIRSVWTITTKPYAEAHFATFPPELPERCIKAGTSEKGRCAKCGAPWKRVIEKKRPEGWEDSGPQTDKEVELRDISKGIYGGNQKSRSVSDIYGRATKSEIKTTGWQPTCECDAEIVPCVVLDPFAGSGTTGEVARSMGRSSILIELNKKYVALIKKRTQSDLTALDNFETK